MGNGERLRLASLPRYIFGAIFVATAVVFTLVASVRGFDKAWDILVAVEKPFGGRRRDLAVALSFLGYVLVPAAVALAISDSIVRLIESRSLTDEQIQDKANASVDRALARKVAPPEQIQATNVVPAEHGPSTRGPT